MPKAIDMTGVRHNMITVLNKADNQGNRTRWSCLCDCGAEFTTTTQILRRGSTKSCGCHRRAATREARTKHGESQGGEHYQRWVNIKQRCYNPSNKKFHRYGGRGVFLHHTWINDFSRFNWYLRNFLGDKPEGHTLDRIDNDGGYEPMNLRWASPDQQRKNQERELTDSK